MLELELPGTGTGNFISDGVGNNVLTFNPETSITMMRDMAILRPDLGANVLGLHSYVNVGRDGKARWGHFSGSQHTLKSRTNNCSWDPKGRMKFDLKQLTACDKEYQQELCPGSLWDTCWEGLLGVGNEKKDWNATPEGASFLRMAIEEMYRTIGNDYYDVVYFSNHPNIEASQENDYWLAAGVDPQEWDDYVDQQLDSDCSGILTTAEMIKLTEGWSHFNLEIKPEDVDGDRYTGDAIALLNKAIRLRRPKFKAWRLRPQDKKLARPTINVTPGIFDRLIEQYTTAYGNIPQGWMLRTEGELGVSMPMAGIIAFGGYWVISREDWTTMDAVTGITSHIVMMQAPGVLGIAGDVSPTGQYNGMGLVINQKVLPPDRGKTYFETIFKVSGMILDTDFIVYGSLYLTPTV
jgi:hypothetical protein